MAKQCIYSLDQLKGGRDVIVVDIGDLKVSSSDRAATIITYALGSCIAVTLYDPVEQIGGMLHFLLPCRASIRAVGRDNPFKYPDTALAALLAKVVALGGRRRRLKVKVIGAASILRRTSNAPDIGRQNYIALLGELSGRKLEITSQDVGGTHSRTAMLDLSSGTVTIRSNRKITEI